MQAFQFARQVVKAITRPGRLLAHCRRILRNRRLHSDDPIEFYSRVVDDNALRDPNRAIGSDSPEHWLSLGEMQFKYLLEYGLQPQHDFLEIGCGNLRLGWRVIQYLEPGRYVGLDISAKILDSARCKLDEYQLQGQRPSLFLVRDACYDFLPADTFDCAYAHAVFTQVPMEVIRAVLGGVRRVVKPGGFFEFTFHPTDGQERHYLREDYYYPRASILDAVKAQGMVPKLMTDWIYHQEKIRAFKP
jgi:ubiquinone/menaquinone biosynthesis C-methylase UbiE